MKNNNIFFGTNKIAKTAKIFNSVVENCEIGENAVIENSLIKNSKILQGATVGPFAHIRDNSEIGENVRIGNFVEIKNSTISAGTKIAHMSYVGDAVVGKNTNIGAGVVFCNYDGKQKHKTVIGDNVFVGSNVNLVAPLVVESNAFIASGSTITRPVKQFENVIARARQTTFDFLNPYLNQTATPKYFKTDGVRGVWGEDLNKNLVKNIAKSLCLSGAKTVVVGRDTRPSGIKIVGVLKNVFSHYGVEVIDLKIATTPVVAFATHTIGADYGIVVTASHNPAKYNGIKIFNSSGEKLTKFEELKIEQNFNKKPKKIIKNNKIKIKNNFLIKKYLNFVKFYLPNNLKNKKIVVDCANGATFNFAKSLFNELGANVILLNGVGEINHACGAVYPEVIQSAVLENKADFGFSFDGDGDRVICVTGKGQVLNGDEILLILTRFLLEENLLPKKVVVGTVMTSVGIEKKLKQIGVNLVRTDVGDRNICTKLKQQNLVLGAEQAGHIILNKDFALGDALLIARVLAYILSYRKHLTKNIKHSFVQVNDTVGIEKCGEIGEKVENAKKKYQTCRFVVRKSGTEPVVRIMVEGKNEKVLNKALLEIKSALQGG